MITVIKLPVVFNITPHEDLAKAERMNIEVEEILEEDFIYINVEDIASLNKSSDEGKSILALRGQESHIKVTMPLKKILSLLEANGSFIINK